MATRTQASAPAGGADLVRVINHVTELEDHAKALVNLADLGAVGSGTSAKAEFAAMAMIAQTDLAWLPSADLPITVREPFDRALGNITINSVKLIDGTPDDYFLFLSSTLAPRWLSDLADLRALAQGFLK